MPTSVVKAAAAAARKLSRAVDKMQFAEPVTHVYNPLDYAWAAYEQYLQRLNPSGVRVLFLGMNPGPWGMVQTGVPFGQVEAVRDWFQIDAAVGRPKHEHPKRPVTGLACHRNEVSGERLWGLFRERFVTPEAFFTEHFVANYCPLVFMEASGKNRTPDKLPVAEREPLLAACDEHLRKILKTVNPEWAVGVGVFAEKALQRVAGSGPSRKNSVRISRVLHPSPASPLANRGWSEAAEQQLIDAGVWQK